MSTLRASALSLGRDFVSDVLTDGAGTGLPPSWVDVQTVVWVSARTGNLTRMGGAYARPPQDVFTRCYRANVCEVHTRGIVAREVIEVQSYWDDADNLVIEPLVREFWNTRGIIETPVPRPISPAEPEPARSRIGSVLSQWPSKIDSREEPFKEADLPSCPEPNGNVTMPLPSVVMHAADTATEGRTSASWNATLSEHGEFTPHRATPQDASTSLRHIYASIVPRMEATG